MGGGPPWAWADIPGKSKTIAPITNKGMASFHKFFIIEAPFARQPATAIEDD
jgi:hypothetical protein